VTSLPIVEAQGPNRRQRSHVCGEGHECEGRQASSFDDGAPRPVKVGSWLVIVGTNRVAGYHVLATRGTGPEYREQVHSVGDERFDGNAVRRLYDSGEYPLPRGT
jgi:hypothetical protein